jgi:hypothetical protein
MAQAPQQGGGGAPRQNKTVKQFQGMNTQNRRNAIPEGSFAWLENIQPIGPGNLHSIPGRGTGATHLPVTTIPPPTTCFPPAQVLTEVAYLGAQIDIDFGSLCMSMGLVETNSGGETIYELIRHSGTVTEVFSIINGVVTDLGLPSWIDSATVGICPNYIAGNALEPAFIHGLGGPRYDNYNLSTQVTFDFTGSNSTGSATRTPWAQGGNFVYLGWYANNSNTEMGIVKMNKTTGAFDSRFDSGYGDGFWVSPISIGVFGNNLYYILKHFNVAFTPPAFQRLFVIDTATMTEITHYDLTDEWNTMFVIRDDLIYLQRPAVAPPGPGPYVDIHYIKNVLTVPQEVTLCDNILLSTGDAVPIGQNFVLYAGLIGNQTFLYYGQSFNAAIHKIGPIVC